MPIETWIAFFFASAIVIAIPGPTVLAVISYSIAFGHRIRAPLVIAVVLGDATALALSLIGLGTVLLLSAFWFAVLKTVGGIYLLYLGINLLRAEGSATDLTRPLPARSIWKLFGNTYAITALNPKGIVFFTAFLPQFINPGADLAPQVFVIALTFAALGTLSTTLYAMFSATARVALSSPTAHRRLNVVGGSVLTGAGIWTLFARRAT